MTFVVESCASTAVASSPVNANDDFLLTLSSLTLLVFGESSEIDRKVENILQDLSRYLEGCKYYVLSYNVHGGRNRYNEFQA